ncbi:YIP1 family protein [Sporosarcina sp. ACRSL]|uniref:YIP1 family protein n=1 Tax=Sporosarcina sp. ACRSL TaxID=2918215 RepID=UPI001EF74393|nr:YIP1 family protein [Sporosarcina sp. ACRSL]MCG7345371.1 YIP1 family protein [Sporosarcina sp. ACRSL]
MQNSEIEVHEARINPWTSVWLHPRKTVQFVMNYKTGSFVLFVAAITGIIHFLDQAASKDLGETWNIVAILLVSLIAGPIIGVIALYLISGIYHAFSLMFRGSGTFEESRKAFTVSNIIIVIGGLIWIPDLLILGQGNFVSDYDFSVGQYMWMIISLLVNSVVGIWSLVALIATFAEVHRFPAWMAALVVFLPIIILVVIVLFIVAVTTSLF